MKNKYSVGYFFHVFNKSIAGFGIFKDLNNGRRFLNTLSYYNDKSITTSFSKNLKTNEIINNKNLLLTKDNAYVKFISYCIMPDHYHLLLKILFPNYLNKYLSDVENSFTRYFNTKFNRLGPLWQSNFKSVKITNNEQLLHVSRYIHLNPTTNGLVKNPEDWEQSSYRDFIFNKNILKNIVTEISIGFCNDYKKFVENQKNYQIKLKNIKKLIFD